MFPKNTLPNKVETRLTCSDKCDTLFRYVKLFKNIVIPVFLTLIVFCSTSLMITNIFSDCSDLQALYPCPLLQQAAPTKSITKLESHYHRKQTCRNESSWTYRTGCCHRQRKMRLILLCRDNSLDRAVERKGFLNDTCKSHVCWITMDFFLL